jgi:predicted component of type VI protein secretion system
MDGRGLTLIQRLSGNTRMGRATPAEALTLALESLLQSRRRPLPERWQKLGSRDAGGVGASVLNYGIPPVENWRLANDAHQNALAREVEQAIEAFEPRIRVLGVSVRIADADRFDSRGGSQWSDQIVLRIQAEWRQSGARVEVEAGWGIEEHRVWFRRKD